MANYSADYQFYMSDSVICEDLKFYPIMMKDWDEFQNCRFSLALMMQSLPAAYISMPFLSALWAIDYDATSRGEKPIGDFARVIHLLYLSLREDITTNPPEIYTEKGKPNKLSYMKIKQGESVSEITPLVFTKKIRPLICRQNAIRLPDEAANAELIEAENDISAADEIQLDYNFSDLLASVAYLSSVREKEIMTEWTIYEFMQRQNAIERVERFHTCAAAEASGNIKFPKGNPYPSWCFNKARKDCSALISAASFTPLSAASQKQ